MFRLIIGLVLSIVLVVLLIQNLQVVSFNFLIWSFEASLSIMLLLTILITIGVNILIILPMVVLNHISKRKKTQEKTKVGSVDQAADGSSSSKG